MGHVEKLYSEGTKRPKVAPAPQPIPPKDYEEHSNLAYHAGYVAGTKDTAEKFLKYFEDKKTIKNE
jgi:hypothetical protein